MWRPHDLVLQSTILRTFQASLSLSADILRLLLPPPTMLLLLAAVLAAVLAVVLGAGVLGEALALFFWLLDESGGFTAGKDPCDN